MEIQEILQNLKFSSIVWQILAPCIFSLCDILVGFIQAVINKDVDSQIMRNGLLHKVLIIIIMEITSILENLKKAGIDIGKLTDILKNK